MRNALLASLFAVFFVTLGFAPKTAHAASSPDEDEAAPATVDPFERAMASLPLKHGPERLSLPHGVEVNLPSGYRFLGQPHAGELMTKMGNLHNEDLLGLVLSENANEGYLVTLRYEEEGFVKDDEKLDAKEILDAIRDGEEEYNQERQKLGFEPIHADRWMEEPRYDKAQHHLVWGLVVSDKNGSSVNFDTRILGRKGYVSVNLVTDPSTLAADRPHGVDILRATTFTAGNRYEDFDKSKDQVAEYGLTGLVLGGAGVGLAKAAKIGLLAKFGKGIVAVLLAGKKAVVAVFAAIAAFARKLFGKSKNAQADAAE